MRELLTFILAGGKGERLHPLTQDRAKPAVPFGGAYRIIDFTLSNCINSGLRRIYVLIQYKSFSLQEHILTGWDVFSRQLGEFIDVIPPQQRIGWDWYLGTADAIYQNLYAIFDHQPERVLILAGDHIYKMDYRKLIDYHKDTGADVTVACVSAPKEDAIHYGVVEVDKKGRVCGFQEKPHEPKTIPGKPDRIFASMGIYLFNRTALVESLEFDAKEKTQHDFGKNIIPQMVAQQKKVYTYNFVDQDGNPEYWRDIGTRDAYYQANMDLINPHPSIDIYDRSWPVRAYPTGYPPTKMVAAEPSKRAQRSHVFNSLIADGCIIDGAKVNRSIVSANVFIGKNAVVSDSLILGNVRIGEHAEIKNSIIDREVIVPPYTRIGFGLKHDRERFAVTSSGIVIVPKRAVI